MNVKIEKSTANGRVKAIPSKSYAHRIAICNFLAGNQPSGCSGDFTSKDIAVTEKCLCDLKCGKTVLDAGESGSTLRFLLPLTASLGGNYEFVGHGKLMDRPNDELFAVLSSHGVVVKKENGRIYLNGKLTNGEYRLRGDISSQYVSGLLMALPTLDGDSEIVLTTSLSSAPYVDITIQVLASFGVEVLRTANGFKIKGNQKYSGESLPEGDWSNSAFMLVYGATCGSVTVTGLSVDSVQGDKAILKALELAGANVSVSDREITVSKGGLNAFNFDGEDCPDLVPIIACLAGVCEGETIINNVKRLRIKESDRIDATIKLLASFGIKATSDGNTLTVYGGKVKSGKVDSFNDHRVVMSASVLASLAEGQSVIENAQAVQKSYPTFFDDFNSVGGKTCEI